ncbi:MAG: hypothetical protein HY925_06525 [Elusimicrobia bacterium]|nr:hypothetical protein [Elusimicrobiota bacterium]
MSAIATAFPEIGASTEPKEVPWYNAVVWSDRVVDGKKVYEWVKKEDIRQVGWSNGLVSISIRSESPLDRDLMYILIQAPFVAVGKNVPV